MLDNQGYKHTLRICNTYCFFTASVLTRMRHNVTCHIRCLTCICLGLYAESFTSKNIINLNSVDVGAFWVGQLLLIYLSLSESCL